MTQQSEFKNSFKNLEVKDLKISGIFSYFNNYFDVKEIDSTKFKKTYIKLKSTGTKALKDIKTQISLENDVIGRK